MNPIDSVFQRLRSQGRKAFMPFITAGDPDLPVTTALVRELSAAGAALIEIGFPYSDPIADGPVIQASYSRVLDRGLRTSDIFAWAGDVTRLPEAAAKVVPLVGMAAYSLVLRRGSGLFLDQAQAAGFHGLIVPDLPVEESEELAGQARARDFKLIQLVTPTTPAARAARIARASTGFLYCVSVTGITGERDRLPDDLLDQLRRLRQETDLPICAGFGISRPEHVQMLREVVDGVIVGSALVRRLEQIPKRPVETVVQEIGDQARALEKALNPPR